MASYPLFALVMIASAHGQADTGPMFVDFEHQGRTSSMFQAECGGSRYVLERHGADWTLRRDGTPIGAAVDAFLTRALGYFDFSVVLTDLDCGSFGGPGVDEGLSFHVVKRFDGDDGPWLQIGTYRVFIDGEEVTHHDYSGLTRRGEPEARVISDLRCFLAERDLRDVPGYPAGDR